MKTPDTRDKLKDLVHRIHGVAETRALFTKLWSEDDVFRRFFLAHRDLLYSSIDEGDLHLRLPLLFAGSEPTEAHEQILVTAGESRLAQMNVLTESVDKQLQEVAHDAKIAACLLALRFFSRNPELAALVSAGEPSWSSVAKLIAAQPPSLDIFNEFVLDDHIPAGADPVLFEKAQRYVAFAKAVLQRGEVVKHAAAIDLASNLIPLYGHCRSQLDRLLDVRDLDEDDHDQVLQDLYLRRLITNIGTTFWCAQCQDETCIFSTRSRLGPDQLRMSCPKCKKQMHVATLYEPAPLVHEAISSQDGMLGVAVGWLLHSRGIAFASGTYARDQELDFRFTVGGRPVLLESKMHRTDKDSETVARTLAADIKQAATHAEQIKNDGQRLDEVWIVTNYDHRSIEAELQQAKARCRGKLDEHNVEFVEAAALPEKLAPAKPRRE